MVKSGRTPISVVLNEASKRKSSAQVAFVDGARLLGDEAAALGVKYPERVYARQGVLLDRNPLALWTFKILHKASLCKNRYTIQGVSTDHQKYNIYLAQSPSFSAPSRPSMYKQKAPSLIASICLGLHSCRSAKPYLQPWQGVRMP